jgi:6-phosphogluconolactonase (cycloisomerase 2 family)
MGLALGLGMTSCSRDYTADYVYVTSATKTTAGAVNAYAVDYQSGALSPLADSPIPSGGNNPVGLVVSPSQKFVYVINNAAPSSNLVEFSVGTDGKLYPENTYPVVQNTAGTIVGSFPTAISMDANGTFLYVTFTYQNGYSTTSPGPGGVAVYPVKTDGSLGAPVLNGNLPYFPVGTNPVALVSTPNTIPASQRYVYVVEQETTGGGTPYGVVLTFSVGSTGALTQVTGALAGGVAAGTTPAGIAEDPSGHYLYITDSTTNQLYGYILNPNGTPQAMVSSPFNTGSYPLGVTVDPRGQYVYVANFGSETVSAFAINTSTGALSGVAGPAGNSVATGPTCVAIEPALGIYLYTSNQIDNSVSGMQLNPHTGALTTVQGTKFAAAALPTCAVAIANGAHASQLVQ